jgi:hypothetical protein
MCVMSLCTRGALDTWSRGRSTAALYDMKILALIVSLLFGCAASAQPMSRPSCEEYQPASDEVSRLIDDSADIPANAELKSACVTRKAVQIRPGQLAESNTITYRFLWNASEPYRNVRILREAECTRTAWGSLDCNVFTALAGKEGDGDLIALQGIATAEELFRFLAFRDRRLGEDYRPIEIRSEGRMDSVYGFHGDGRKIAYDLAITCNSANECTWNVLRQYEWRH